MKWLISRWNTFLRVREKIGIIGVIIVILKKYSNKITSLFYTPDNIDIVQFYSFINSSPFGEEYIKNNGNEKIMNWVIPDFGIGSGGHINIFRIIGHLEKDGIECRIIIDGPCQFNTEKDARDCISKHFFPLKAEVSIGSHTMRPAWGSVATSWQTAYTVRNFRGSEEKFYFVQDFEPYFFARGSYYYFAEQTYRFGFKGITAGNWLAQKLSEEYGMETYPISFSYDHELYQRKKKKEKSFKRVFFYARPVTDRRGFELGLLALNEVHNRDKSIEFIFAGWDISGYKINFPYLNAGVVAMDALADLYSQCEVALVISSTNLSLLPLELMACGCPVVSNKGKNVEWLLNESNSILAEPTVENLSQAILNLLNDDEKRKRLIENGIKYSETTSWEDEAKKVCKLIDNIYAGN